MNTLIPHNTTDITPVYNPAGDLKNEYRVSYITSNVQFGGYPKLRSTDRVAMADGTWKAPNEIQVGDVVKSLIIPDPNGVDPTNEEVDYNIDLNTFNAGVEFTTSTVNDITYIKRMKNSVFFDQSPGIFKYLGGNSIVYNNVTIENPNGTKGVGVCQIHPREQSV